MEKYEFVAEIEEGGSAKVNLMKKKETGEVVAVKLLKRGRGNIDDQVVREVLIHRSLRLHPNVTKFKEVVLTPTHLAIVMEYAARGDLADLVFGHHRGLDEDKARKLFQQLISALQYMHIRRICHRDLKPNNLLLDSEENLKICDFGLSLRDPPHDFNPSDGGGTLVYTAPEIVSSLYYDGGGGGGNNKYEYDLMKADVWSCGVVLYNILVGEMLFEDEEDHDEEESRRRKIIERIKRARYKIPDHIHISQDAKHLLSRMLVADPTRRITAREIQSHPWYLEKLPDNTTDVERVSYSSRKPTGPLQTEDQIKFILEQAKSV